jgi:hypothetical protein
MSGQLSRDARRVEGTSSMGEGEGHGRFYLGVVTMNDLLEGGKCLTTRVTPVKNMYMTKI